MTEDNAGSKLTLSGKSTLTLKNLGSKKPEGSKVVQVEVRKKRVISPTPAAAAPKVEIDEATAAKLKLIAEAKSTKPNAARKKKKKPPCAKNKKNRN